MCGTVQKLMIDGSCEVCPEWERQEFGGKSCAGDNCFGSRERLLITGKCEDCELFTIPADDKKSCIESTCTER